jgi:hypothetical protein
VGGTPTAFHGGQRLEGDVVEALSQLAR